MAVDVVCDGEAALERLGVNRYDVAVIDRDMPGQTGDAVCRRIVDSGAATRVLLLSAAAGIRRVIRRTFRVDAGCLVRDVEASGAYRLAPAPAAGYARRVDPDGEATPTRL